MGSKKSLNSCPRCGAPWMKFDDNWDTFRCGLKRNVCSGYILESEGCLESVIEDRDARIAALTEELERVKGRIQETIDYVKTGIHCRMVDHKYNDSCDCGPITDEFAKILKEPT